MQLFATDFQTGRRQREPELVTVVGLLRVVGLVCVLLPLGACASPPIDSIIHLSEIPGAPPDPNPPGRALGGGYEAMIADTDILGPYRAARLDYAIRLFLKESYGTARPSDVQIADFARENRFDCEPESRLGERLCVHDRSVPFRASLPFGPTYRRVRINLVLTRDQSGLHDITRITPQLVR